MKKWYLPFAVLIAFLFLITMPVMAAENAEIEQLKGEVQKLLNRIEELEKKQAETQTKTIETEKKVAEAEKKVEKVEKKSLKDRINLSGEARFRIMRETATTDAGFYGGNNPSGDSKWVDETSFPLRIRLNMNAEVVPDIVDFYARLTINKRWGAYDTTATDPFNKPNSFESSIGHDMTPRFEQAYMTLKIPSVNGTWYIGRLPGLDGAPSRAERSLFPRLFIDSEIDGTLLKWDAPETALDKANLPWTSTRLWGKQSEPGKAPTLKSYEAKVKDRTGIILGYLKYDEKKITANEDADAYLAQAQLKVGKDTAVILDGLYMDDWHMPRTSFGSEESIRVRSSLTDPSQEVYITVPDLKSPYWLTGGYVDTQLFGFQIYGAYYYSHFKIPDHTVEYHSKAWGVPPAPFTDKTFEEQGFPGHMWFVGFNTGDLITPNQQLTVEYAKGSDAWINPFNYRGYRRKGTVLQPANNYFYNPVGVKDTIVGFYPFNAGVLDAYYDYYFKQKVRFRLGLIDFIYSKHDINGGTSPVLGSSKFQHDYWPYFEVNISF